mmetsp:Transcript_121360/g.329511  ORF Transcript_121360/g.329511 Transcript_121360/m.329511 type:complete len:388 (+) Transcript_121360:381-1544(+)
MQLRVGDEAGGGRRHFGLACRLRLCRRGLLLRGGGGRRRLQLLGQSLLQRAPHHPHQHPPLLVDLRLQGGCSLGQPIGLRVGLAGVVGAQLAQEADHDHLELLHPRQPRHELGRLQPSQLAAGRRPQEPEAGALLAVGEAVAPLDGELLQGPQRGPREREAPIQTIAGRCVATLVGIRIHVVAGPPDGTPQPSLCPLRLGLLRRLLVLAAHLGEELLHLLLLVADLPVPVALDLLLHLLPRRVAGLHLQKILQRSQALLQPLHGPLRAGLAVEGLRDQVRGQGLSPDQRLVARPVGALEVLLLDVRHRDIQVQRQVLLRQAHVPQRLRSSTQRRQDALEAALPDPDGLVVLPLLESLLAFLPRDGGLVRLYPAGDGVVVAGIVPFLD